MGREWNRLGERLPVTRIKVSARLLYIDVFFCFASSNFARASLGLSCTLEIFYQIAIFDCSTIAKITLLIYTWLLSAIAFFFENRKQRLTKSALHHCFEKIGTEIYTCVAPYIVWHLTEWSFVEKLYTPLLRFLRGIWRINLCRTYTSDLHIWENEWSDVSP